MAVNTALAAVRLLRDQGAVTIRPNAGAQVRNRAQDVDFPAELKKVRAQVSELRTEVHQFDAALKAIETQIASLAEHADEERNIS